MWSSPQYYSYPSSSYTNPPGKKDNNPILKIFLIIFVIFIVMSSIFVVYITLFTPDFLNTYHYGYEGYQTYEGNTTKSELTSHLNNASFGARDNPTNRGDIRFHPFCGVINTSQANESYRLMTTSYTSIAGKTVTVSLLTNFLNSSARSKLKQGLSCVMSRMKSIYVNDLGLIFINQQTSENKHSLPGFELPGLIMAVVVIIYFKKRKMSKKGNP